MKQLSGLDASFLYMETPQMPMHVGALHLFEMPASYKGDFVADMRKHMAARLPLAPALRRKLAWMPFNLANPVWIDAMVDLDDHIVPIKLKKGGGMAELEAKVGELHPKLLDRDKPLWKFYLFEGLAPGPNKEKRYGMYTQLHHAAVDGQAAVALAAAILDVSPEARDIKVKDKPRNLHIGMAQMLSGVFANQLNQYANIVKGLPTTMGALGTVVKQGAGGVTTAAMAKVRGDGPKAENSVSLGLAPRTKLNASVSATRAFASASLPMAELKALRRAHDATLNDVVLMVCSGALRRYFLDHGPLPRKSLVAAVPVSTRAAGDTSSNNQASMTVVNLGTHIADPMKRLLYVKAATAAMKATTIGSVKSLMPIDFPSLGVPWLMSAVSSVYGRAKMADRIPPVANVAISNVPGPAFPLYMAGAKMLVNCPTSIVVHGVALNITVQSYNESLDFGIIACGKAMPDVAELAAHVHEEFEALKALPPTALAVAPTAVAAGAPVAAKKAKAIAAKAAAKPSAARRKPVAKATASPRASAPAK